MGQINPVSLHPENPHYFIYKNKPTVLITSGEHYGAVINTGFDYITYLDELASRKLNLTRIFTGSYVESSNAFNILNNTLAPVNEKFISPWKRSNEPGYAGGGNKFDLSQWDQAYFRRLKDFLSAARKRGIIVEITLFCPFYEDTLWKLSPMNSRNNINGIDTMPATHVYTLNKNSNLLAMQEQLVRKMVNELNDFDNIFFEICNEPYFGGVTIEWQHHIADIITAVEKDLPNKHLISQNIANGSAKIENPHPAVSIFNFHYAWPPVTVPMNYHLNKAIGDDETGFRGNTDSTYRIEGWRFILAGGSLYNNLDYSFAPGYENGTFKYPAKQPGGGTDSLRRQLSYLQEFFKSFDFIHMRPDSSLVIKGSLNDAEISVLSEPGKQYAVYFYGSMHASIEIAIPGGEYEASWLNTVTGKYIKKETIKSKNGKAKLSSPSYVADIALRILRKK